MIQVTYRLKLGQDEFELKADVKDEKEFFETMSFYSSLPKTAPGGATDLKVSFRTTTEGHKYYSLISESEKMEFKFGQNKDTQGGGLFPKNWAPLYQAEGSQQTAPAVQTPTKVSTKPAVQPVPQATPIVAASAPMPTPVQPAAVTPQVAAAASNVLARFGINK